MNLINFILLVKLVFVLIGILRRHIIQDRDYTHYMRIYSKIHTSIKGHVNMSDMSLEDWPSVVTMLAFPFIVLGHFCRFYA